jgi:hypothetical protein
MTVSELPASVGGSGERWAAPHTPRRGTARFQPESEDQVPGFAGAAHLNRHPKVKCYPMTDQTEYIAHEAQALHASIARGDVDDAAVTAATLLQELEHLLDRIDPDGVVAPRITTSNGTYIYPSR